MNRLPQLLAVAAFISCLTPSGLYSQTANAKKSRASGVPCTPAINADGIYNTVLGTPDNPNNPTDFSACIPAAPAGTTNFIIDYVSAETAFPGQNLQPAAVFHLFLNGARLPLIATAGYNSSWSVLRSVHIVCKPLFSVDLDPRQFGGGAPIVPTGGSFTLIGHYE